MQTEERSPKIVKWGRKYGAVSPKGDRYIKAYQKATGSNKNSSPVGRKKRWRPPGPRLVVKRG